MRSGIVILERSSLHPKSVWREASCRRTLMPLEVAHLISNAWRSSLSEAVKQGLITASLTPDGSTRVQAVRPLQGQQKHLIWMFAVSFLTPDRAKVVLREEECARWVGSPRRHTRQIALLRPWKPVRILLNGRSASYAGQYYHLREYYLALCTEPAPDRLAPMRLVDLQASLF